MTAPEKVVIGNAELWHGDCREVLPLLPKHDLLCTDPPYGIGEAAGKAKTRSGSAGIGGGKYVKDYGHSDWDIAPISDELLAAAISAARHAIVFGGNYYNLPKTTCWLVWDKLNGDNDFADCELAWTNLPKAVRRIQFLWNGMLRANGEKRGDHPTQKPVGVMQWCVEQVPHAHTVLDPFMGSGTTGVACAQLGKAFTGIERERKYFDIACERISRAQAQGTLLPPDEPRQQVQEAFQMEAERGAA
jgi:site-specific DNA-methyltransferase (adenine-specific)/modification methylase